MIINYIGENVDIFEKSEIEHNILNVIRELSINVDIKDLEVQIAITGPLDNDTEGAVKVNGKVLFTFTGNMQTPVANIEKKV